MKIKTTLSKSSPEDFQGDTLIFLIYPDAGILPHAIDAIDSRYARIISGVIERNEFRGRLGETLIIPLPPELPIKRIVLSGMGPKADADNDTVRRASAVGVRVVQNSGGKIALSVPEYPRNSRMEEWLAAVYEGFMLALYKFDKYRAGRQERSFGDVKSFHLLIPDERNPQRFRDVINRAEIMCDAVYFGRDIINAPANDFNTISLMNEVKKLRGKSRVTIDIYNRDKLKKLGLNAILAVGGGSNSPAGMGVMRYNGGRKGDRPIVLVGKGVAFDSGGISIKPAPNMDEMKQDMAGAAVVLSAFRAAVEMQLPINLIAIVPTVENMPSGTAYRPGDIIRTHSGLTVEVISTDAEGRLILADALSLAKKYNPSAIIDVATLTGAVKVALGTAGCAVLGYHDSLIEKIEAASESTGEKVWRLPMWPEFDKQIDSHIADIKNSGGKFGGTITAAKFLSKFIKDYNWAHLDIAGVDYAEADGELWRKGATGFGIRLTINLLENWKDT